MNTKYLERTRAIVLRKQGKTLLDIAHELHVSKSSVSIWVRNVILSNRAREILEGRKVKGRLLANQVKRNITLSKLKEVNHEAEVEVTSFDLNSNSALISCALMYWCEGSKSNDDSEFTFTNSDPLIIAGFLALLRKAIDIDESMFRVKMHLHPYHKELVQKKFWSQVTRIPETQFQNTYWKKNSGTNIKSNYPGCIHVRYHNVVVARKISAVARNFLKSISVIE